MKLAELLQKRSVRVLIVIIITLVAYSNIFQNQFVQDDFLLIVNWDIPKNFNNIPLVFGCYSVQQGCNTGDYKPIRTVFLMIFYQLLGTNPLGYHLVSLLIHIINIILVYLVIDKITKKRLIAFVSSLLFALHPIQTESITFMSVSVNTIGISFYLASFYLYLKARDKLPKYSLSYVVSVILAGLAFFTYEMTITLPLIILFYDLVFKHLNLKKINIYNALKIYAPYLILALFYLFVRMILLHIQGRADYLGGSFYLTMLTMAKAFVKYIELLILPINLSIYPNVAPGISSSIGPYAKMDKILSQSILDLDILRNIGIILSLIAATIIFLKRSPLVSFAIGFFMISLLPASNLIPLAAIMQERYAYLPSFGFVLLVGGVFEYVYSLKYPKSFKGLVKPSLIIFLLLISLGYSYRTYLRNRDWKSTISLWTSLVKEIPDHGMGYYVLGVGFENNNDNNSAINNYKKAIEVWPKMPDSYYRLGLIYQREGNKDQAEAYFKDFRQALGYGYSAWSEFDFLNSFSFFYPNIWKITKTDDGLDISNNEHNFIIQISLDSMSKFQTMENYLKQQKKDFGSLVSQGPAQIPNFDSSYLKVFTDNEVTKLQFFLFKDSKVAKVLIYPNYPSLLSIFDQILVTMRFN